jgi:radical SAM superfamily enzyme YgiQ (UPF0313 family)
MSSTAQDSITTSGPSRWNISPALLIAVTDRGVFLPAAEARPEWELGPRHLDLLEGLARGDRPAVEILDQLGADRDGGELLGFLNELSERHLVSVAEEWSGSAPPQLREAGSAPEFPAGDRLILITPLLFRVTPAGFDLLDHDGTVRARLGAAALAVAAEFRVPKTPEEVQAASCDAAARDRIAESEFHSLLHRLGAAGLLERLDPDNPTQRHGFASNDREMRKALKVQWTLERVVREEMAARDAEAKVRAARTGRQLTKVLPFHFQWQLAPLSLGMLMAYAMKYDGGRLGEHYDFRASWTGDSNKIPPASEPAAVFLFSHYIWSSVQNLEHSALAKAANPRHVTIHGGPNVPKYPGDVDTYFAAHPHVDVAVHGEGEITLAEALDALAPELAHGGTPKLSVLADVPGLTFRDGARTVRTADRPRLTDLDTIPSPFLNGLFDRFVDAELQSCVVETNRGCPYGCTFCDWGSATTQRIRQFSLERVFAELEWCAKNGSKVIALADANFGIFERDVAIAEKIAELRGRYGYPHHFGVNYAKNSIKHLKPIVKILCDAGILAYGQLSLQSTDKGTLATVRRSNIKLEKYDELAQEFRQAGLPLFIDLMMGLPGATVQSFRNDLQEAIDREVIPKAYPTQLLVNSPMNEPAYREANKIVAKPGELVTSSATFTEADYESMKRVRRMFMLLWKFGVLRHVANYLRQEVGLAEMDFYERLWRDAQNDRGRWSMIAFTLDTVPSLMIPPGRWRTLLDEVHDYLVDEIGVADDSALATVLAVQNLMLPARHRRFPETIELGHDFSAWHAAMVAAKDAGHQRDWPTVVPALRTLPPGTLTVEDPNNVCVFGMGQTVDSDPWGVWELASPVSRPVLPLHAVID